MPQKNKYKCLVITRRYENENEIARKNSNKSKKNK